MWLLSILGTVLKLGGIVIGLLVVYFLVFGIKGARFISPICSIAVLGVTAALCISFWNTTKGDVIYILIHAILPAIVAYVVGATLFGMEKSLPVQLIGAAAGFGLVFLITHLLSGVLDNVVSLIIGAVAFYFIGKVVLGTIGDSARKSINREEELKKASYTRGLDYHELRELNRLTYNKVDLDRDRALNDYNKYHQNDPLDSDNIE